MSLDALVINTLVWAAELGLISIGMTLVYALLRFANFAHAEFATAGAYVTYTLHVTLGLPIILAVPGAMVCIGIFAVIVNELVFARIRRAGPVPKMVVSVGIAMIIRSVITLIYGTSALSIGYSTVRLPEWIGLRLTDLQLVIILATVASMLLLHVAMHRTKLGKALRATADNHNLAEARGINTAGVTRWMWFISGAFAAMGGALIGMETQLRPVLGQFLIMPMFAAATVGGLGSVYGAVAGSFVIALAQNLALGINFGPLFDLPFLYLQAGYKDAVALAVLVLTLLLRPAGIFSRRRG